MGMNRVINAIKDKGNKRFLVTSHQNMEGDAIGSMLALAELLKVAGKQVVLFPPEDTPEAFEFLPGAAKLKRNKNPNRMKYDIACFVDCTDPGRLGDAIAGICKSKPIINIDHHISNTRFGWVNWVEPEASCSGEQIYRLFKKMNLQIGKKAALYIYIAILTDTGSFKYSNTTSDTHRIAAELISHDIKPTDIYRRIYEQTPKSRLKLLSAALSTIDTTKDGRISWMMITAAMLKKYSAHVDDTQDFINFPRSIKGIKIAIAFKQISKDTIKVTLRSNDGVDVNKLAKAFNGGGHASASGCTVKADMAPAVKMVLAKAKELLKE
jgi:bifunctional oligoribonuclease and PAP phosphatase NrnA